MLIRANTRQFVSMTVDADLHSRPAMRIPVTVESLAVRFALKPTSSTLLVMGTLLLGMPHAGMAQTVPRTLDDLRAESHQGETVYVTDVAGATTKGRVLRISANSIALIVEEPDPRLAGIRGEVDHAAPRERRAWSVDRTGGGSRARTGAGGLGQWR